MSECITVEFDEREASRQLLSFKKNSDLLNNNKRMLRRKYREQFVAIRNGEVIEVNEDIDALFQILQDRGIPSNEVLIEFMPRDDIIWIL